MFLARLPPQYSRPLRYCILISRGCSCIQAAAGRRHAGGLKRQCPCEVQLRGHWARCRRNGGSRCQGQVGPFSELSLTWWSHPLLPYALGSGSLRGCRPRNLADARNAASAGVGVRMLEKKQASYFFFAQREKGQALAFPPPPASPMHPLSCPHCCLGPVNVQGPAALAPRASPSAPRAEDSIARGDLPVNASNIAISLIFERASCGIRAHDLPLTERVLCQAKLS